MAAKRDAARIGIFLMIASAAGVSLVAAVLVVWVGR